MVFCMSKHLNLKAIDLRKDVAGAFRSKQSRDKHLFLAAFQDIEWERRNGNFSA